MNILYDETKQIAKDVTRSALAEHKLGRAWINVSPQLVSVFLLADPDMNELSVMLAAQAIEQTMNVPTTVSSLSLLSPAEQATMRETSELV